jgi:hypothetical protein
VPQPAADVFGMAVAVVVNIEHICTLIIILIFLG